MATITATEFKQLFNAADLDSEHAEVIIDQAIDRLNLESNADVPNMSGTAGSKTWSGTSQQKGAIYLVARAVYESFYKGIDTVNLGALGLSQVDVMSNPTVLRAIERAGRKLAEFDVSYG